MNPHFFSDTTEFRKWLEQHHDSESEVIVGYYKVKTGKPSMTWSDSVDEALCFGWIDGIRRNIDGDSYCNRFTPRRPKSNWSDINLKKVELLIEQNRMHPSGLAIYEQRQTSKSANYSYENQSKMFETTCEARFQENPDAWNFFLKQPPSYRKTMIHWVTSAKSETTVHNRLTKLIDACSNEKRLY